MSKLKKTALLFFVAIVFFIVHKALFTGSSPRKSPDLLLINANAITMDSSQPHAEAVLVSNGRIRKTGNREELQSIVSTDIRTIDLKGKTLIPGFNDNHTHIFSAGQYYWLPNLWKKSCQEIVDIVQREVSGKKPGELISGNSWDYPFCPHPDKSLLDKVSPNNPVYLTQYSGHAAWVNSYKLGEMKIDRDTPDPEGGQIMRDKNGEPTGILRDKATGLTGYLDTLSDIFISRKHRRYLEKALENMRKVGVTSVQDNTWMPITVWHLNNLKAEGKLTSRFSVWSLDEYIPGAKHLMKLASYDQLWIHKGPLKYFADGAFSTRTAWMLSEAYADEPGNFGSPIHTAKEMDELVKNAAEKRQQIAIHAIGDGAVHQILNSIEKAQALYPWTRELRFRIEHIQLISEPDIARMKQLGVIACIQPFSISSPRKDIQLLGEQRAQRAYPFYSLRKAGIPVSFGSDVPAEVDYNPMLGLYYAITRKNLEGTFGPLNASEKFSPYEALFAYTMGSAYAEFMEDEKGSITPGKLADMVVLSHDPTKVEEEFIKNIGVLMTIVDGRIVYQNKLELP